MHLAPCCPGATNSNCPPACGAVWGTWLSCVCGEGQRTEGAQYRPCCVHTCSPLQVGKAVKEEGNMGVWEAALQQVAFKNNHTLA